MDEEGVTVIGYGVSCEDDATFIKLDSSDGCAVYEEHHH